jgi:hypothetical protein
MGFPYKRFHIPIFVPSLCHHPQGCQRKKQKQSKQRNDSNDNNDDDNNDNRKACVYDAGCDDDQSNKCKEGEETDDDTDHDENNDGNDVMSSNMMKRQYKMIGNAVCPPLIASIAGAVLHCCPMIVGYHHHPSWIEYGRHVAIHLAYEATLTKI